MAQNPTDPDRSEFAKFVRGCQIVTNCAVCEPTRLRHEDGTMTWQWVVTEFIDDSYLNGKVVFPKEYADNLEDLLEFMDEEDD